ncbi:hypothetical protein BHE74_00002032 [Ensete ventricosum]|nr:hypothetical protein BHE74_00002032 [Ensete ventricosum]
MRDHPHQRDGFDPRAGRGRGPRVFAPGDLKLLLPALIAEQPCHGYDLIRQIESLFDGAYTPSPGVIYPTLTFLEESDLIQGDADGGKKRYTITDAGRLFLSEQQVALDGVRMRIDVSKRSLRGHDRPPEIHEAVHNLLIHRVSHEIKRRRLEVLRVVDITPRMRRITLGGPELAGFVSLGSDDHIKLLFPQNAAEQAALESPTFNIKGDGPQPAMRDYTPRRFDLSIGELDIDFVLHGDGPASTWADQVQVGQHLYIGGPRGSMIVPDIFDSYLLIGDETALPAIARRLEELPAGRTVLAVIEIANAAEKQALNSAANVEVIWVIRGQDDLLETVQKLTLPSGSLYSFVATETKLSRQVRRVLLDTHKVNEEFLKAVGYWRAEGSEEE